MCEPILLVASNGMLGRAFDNLLAERGATYECVNRAQVDLTSEVSVDEALRESVGTVINCAGYTDVDGVETAEADATLVNGDGVGRLAERCRTIGARLVHFSTDYVFDGQATQPYPVDHPVCPVNAYGRSKAAGERLVRASRCDHLMVRTSWLYAPWGNNFVRTIDKLAQVRPTIQVVDDQVGRPTSALYLASRVMDLLEHEALGTFHVTDGGSCTWYDLACAIVDRIEGTCQVEPIKTDASPRAAKRPAYSVLDLTATEALIGPSVPWRQNLAAIHLTNPPTTHSE